MRIGLINPPYHHVRGAGDVGWLEKKRGIYPSLGLGYIAALLEQNGYEVDYIDIDALELNPNQLQNFLGRKNYNIVGITATSYTMDQARLIAYHVREALPECSIVIGGPHLYIYPLETLHTPLFDFGIYGEGEYTMLDLVKTLEAGGSLMRVEGLIYKKSGYLLKNPPRPLIENLDSLPFPARHLMPNRRFYCPISYHPFTIMIASRGCPFNCLFCMRPRYMQHFRIRSAKNVVDEMEDCVQQFGIREILFYDDTFTVQQQRIFEICAEIRRRGLNVRWDCRTRVDLVSKKLLIEMAKAGCVRIHYGIEAGDERILNFLRKSITLAQVREALQWTEEVGIETLAYFMIGSPGENLKTIRKTVNFAKELNPDYAIFYVTSAYPGTDLYDLALEKGVVNRDVWADFSLGKGPRPTIYFNVDELKGYNLESIAKKAHNEFYFRPQYIIKCLRCFRSFSDISQKMRELFAFIFLQV